MAAAVARQNHVIFGRRGCGKTLLLHASASQLQESTRRVYLNCEDFKHHSFPNVLIEILEAIFLELQNNLSGWFGKKAKQREIISGIREKLKHLRESPDVLEEQVTRAASAEQSRASASGVSGEAGRERARVSVGMSTKDNAKQSIAETSQFARSTEKMRKLNDMLPGIKQQLRDFFGLTNKVQTIILQVDDFYHLRLADQPFVIDYIHRLCKDLPMYFKVATLRHASSLFVERERQPIGVQERHDFLPIDIDFTFENFGATEKQLRRIFHAYGHKVGLRADEVDNFFKGDGFTRLIFAGGGVPRDCLSMFLDAQVAAQDTGDGRIGKDTVRLLSLQTFEHRIKDLKKDSHADQQDALLRGIYAIREFCLSNKSNAFVIEERELRDSPILNELVYRLLDYRIVHMAASAFTHKTHPGTYRSFVIDVGCYGFWRKLEGKMNEIDVSDKEAKERMRSSARLTSAVLEDLRRKAPSHVESAIKRDPDE